MSGSSTHSHNLLARRLGNDVRQRQPTPLAVFGVHRRQLAKYIAERCRLAFAVGLDGQVTAVPDEHSIGGAVLMERLAPPAVCRRREFDEVGQQR
jgi:hypothetical protein